MPGPKVAVNASGDWLYFVTGKCLDEATLARIGIASCAAVG